MRGAEIKIKKYEECFSDNIKRLRFEAGMTQKALAQAVGYSEKTVSKWECASSIPDISVLFKLAGLLRVPLDELFRDDSEVYFLGIDGGGTKTELLLANENGETLRSLHADCCNPIDIGLNAAERILKDAVYELCEGVRFSSIAMFAGIAGGISSDMKARLADFFCGFGFRCFENDSDNRNIIAAGLGKRDGITLILGTGICAYSVIAGKTRRVSGWGYLIDGGGSAYNIGRDSLEAFFCARDGSGRASILTDEIGKLCPAGEQALLGEIYQGVKKKIASFAPLAFRAAEAGDAAADGIIRRNMAYAASLIETLSVDFKAPVIPVIIAGGLTEQPALRGYLEAALGRDTRCSLESLSCAPVSGAVLLARELYASNFSRERAL